MEQENQPEKIQFVIVPEFILTDSKIPIGEKLLFGDIASHTKQKGYCWGSNEYFEKRYKVSSRTISRWINDLKKRNLIITNMIYQKNSLQVTERQIMINTCIPSLKKYMSWYGHQCQQGQDNNVQSPIVTDVQENNKGMNNKTIYLKESAGTNKSELHQKPSQRTCSNYGRMAKENHACSGRADSPDWPHGTVS